MFDFYEIIGYVASVLVAVSLSMKNIVKLRWLNLTGSITFSVYGFVIGAYPVFAVNAYIAIINIYFILQMYSKKDSFLLVKVAFNNDSYLDEFIKTYEKDITNYYPNFRKEDLQKYNCCFVLRNLNPAGLFVYEQLSEKEIKVIVDYAIPDYRDLKNAMYLYSTEFNLLKNSKISKITAETNVDEHKKYLTNIGFKQENNSDIFIKTV